MCKKSSNCAKTSKNAKKNHKEMQKTIIKTHAQTKRQHSFEKLALAVPLLPLPLTKAYHQNSVRHWVVRCGQIIETACANRYCAAARSSEQREPIRSVLGLSHQYTGHGLQRIQYTMGSCREWQVQSITVKPLHV